MHRPVHAEALPPQIDPMPMPDSEREAELLALLLEIGLYPKLVPQESDKVGVGRGNGKACRF